jgi:hypothetical protein
MAEDLSHAAQHAAPPLVTSSAVLSEGEKARPLLDSSLPDTDSSNEPPVLLTPPPPNGGVKAWTQVVMGHLVLINGWGYLSSFGLFQSYYTSTLDVTPSAVSWIGSMQIFLVYLVGTFSGRAISTRLWHLVHFFKSSPYSRLLSPLATGSCSLRRVYAKASETASYFVLQYLWSPPTFQPNALWPWR